MTADDMVMVPKSALRWLFGEGPDANGNHFGDDEVHNTHRGAYWWRNKFQAMISAAPVPPSEPGGWLPIETAPRDQLSLLYSERDQDIVIKCWGLFCKYNVARFTHWMPLPPSPGSALPSPPGDEAKLKKRPVAFRVRMMADCPWEYYGDEDTARQAADVYCGDYEALFVRDGTPINLDPPRDEVVEALRMLYRQALQSTVNEPSNEYGQEALAVALAALSKLEGRS